MHDQQNVDLGEKLIGQGGLGAVITATLLEGGFVPLRQSQVTVHFEYPTEDDADPNSQIGKGQYSHCTPGICTRGDKIVYQGSTGGADVQVEVIITKVP